MRRIPQFEYQIIIICSGFELHCGYCYRWKSILLKMAAHMATLIMIVYSSNGGVTGSNRSSSLDFS